MKKEEFMSLTPGHFLNPDAYSSFTTGSRKNIGFWRVTRLRAPPGHGGAGRCYRIFSGSVPPRGRPAEAEALILIENEEGGIHELNTRSFS
jgi:hypothetical protein